MKKYTSRAVKWLGLLSLLGMTLLVAGIVLIAVDFPNASLKIFFDCFRRLSRCSFRWLFFCRKEPKPHDRRKHGYFSARGGAKRENGFSKDGHKPCRDSFCGEQIGQG